MTVNQNGLKISLRGDISLQVRHIPLPYFNDFMVPTSAGLIAENAFPRNTNSKISWGPPFCKNLIPPQDPCINIRTRDNSELQVGTNRTVVT